MNRLDPLYLLAVIALAAVVVALHLAIVRAGGLWAAGIFWSIVLTLALGQALRR